jgi:hypothetical protein
MDIEAAGAWPAIAAAGIAAVACTHAPNGATASISQANSAIVDRQRRRPRERRRTSMDGA